MLGFVDFAGRVKAGSRQARCLVGAGQWPCVVCVRWTRSHRGKEPTWRQASTTGHLPITGRTDSLSRVALYSTSTEYIFPSLFPTPGRSARHSNPKVGDRLVADVSGPRLFRPQPIATDQRPLGPQATRRYLLIRLPNSQGSPVQEPNGGGWLQPGLALTAWRGRSWLRTISARFTDLPKWTTVRRQCIISS